ncbi:MAG: hypothetical protein HYZ57_09930 [Acidobacteria bacterium]|nr:hypothetical protein [Acidobacteriota bacterium]MBI3280146.1 hypothetical protein [Acidobacteriota bacterium]
MATKKAASKKRSQRGRGKVEKVMHEYKHGQLKSGGRGKVKSRKQAVAIALNEARESGARIPKKRSAKKTASKKTASNRRGSRRS